MNMAEIWRAMKAEASRRKWYTWLGYTLWAILAAVNLSFIQGSLAEKEGTATLFGVVVFAVLLGVLVVAGLRNRARDRKSRSRD